MALIDDIKTILHNAVSDGQYRLPCKRGNTNIEPINGIFLYYTNNNNFTGTSRAGYYAVGVQVAVRHNDYDKARAVCLLANQKLKSNPDAIAGTYINVVSPPEYKGVDAMGGYIFGFDTQAKGGE